MNIKEACRTIRLCNDALSAGRQPAVSAALTSKAVQVLKTFLQAARGDGQRIVELEMPGHVAYTPEGISRVMPFVVSAEAMLMRPTPPPQIAL